MSERDSKTSGGFYIPCQLDRFSQNGILIDIALSVNESEDFLTESQIIAVIEESKHPKYSDVKLMHSGNKKTSIFRVSNRTGLILIHGNSDTGMEHIRIRHSLSSRKPDWEGQRLENTTKFPLSLAPIDYLKIADQVFGGDNLNNSENNNPDQFDVYVGPANFKETTNQVRLVLYKGTKIIHSFFISRGKPFNKYRRSPLNLRQGWVSSQHNPTSGVEISRIPYSDSNEVERFVLIRFVHANLQLERWFLQCNGINGVPIHTVSLKAEIIESLIQFPWSNMSLNFEDVVWAEKSIKNLMEGKPVSLRIWPSL